MVDCAVRCRFSPCGKVNSLMALLEIFERILGENSLLLGNISDWLLRLFFRPENYTMEKALNFLKCEKTYNML